MDTITHVPPWINNNNSEAQRRVPMISVTEKIGLSDVCRQNGPYIYIVIEDSYQLPYIRYNKLVGSFCFGCSNTRLEIVQFSTEKACGPNLPAYDHYCWLE